MNLIINGLASHFAKRLVRTHDLPQSPQRDNLAEANGVGVSPRNYEGAYYNTDLSLGTTETAQDITIKSAVCTVTMTKQIVSTPITGRDGTVKELISTDDYEISVSFALMSDSDEYPEEAMRALVALAKEKQSLYVDSDFLRIFDIDRVTVVDLKLDQATYGNVQDVTLTLKSDDDYEVMVSE